MSVIDFKQKTKPSAIWDGDKLKPQVKSFALGILKSLFPNMIGAYVLGSITTNRYSSASDFDVDVVLPEKTDIEVAKAISGKFNDREIKVPQSPYVFKIQPVHESDRKNDLGKALGAYDIISGKWIKKPEDLGVDPRQYDESFRSKIRKTDADLGELNRDVTDMRLMIESFRGADKDTQKQILEEVEQKKQEIDSDIETLVADYDTFRKARVEAFDREFQGDPAAANKYYLNQALPGSVIFKMMERYGYRELLTKLRDIHGTMHS